MKLSKVKSDEAYWLVKVIDLNQERAEFTNFFVLSEAKAYAKARRRETRVISAVIFKLTHSVDTSVESEDNDTRI